MTTTIPRPTRGEHEQPSPRTQLGSVQASLLVAEREITTQVRNKSFLISLAITVLITVVGILISGFIGGDEEPTTEVAVVAGADALDEEHSDAGLEIVAAPDQEAAEQLLRDGDVEAIITTDEESPVGLRVIGLDAMPTEVAQALSVSPSMEVLDPSAEGPLRFIIALLFGLVFMLLSIGSGMMIVQNTIQEKQSRIVEILLSSISSRSLLAGKIMGNSALALGQAVVIAAAAALALMVSGQQDLLDVLTVPMLWFVLFFLPGFVLVAAIFAASAALVSRQEDSGTVVTPAMMLVMMPYFVVVFFYDNPLVMTIASYIPFTAPVAMPLRMFFNEAAWFEPLLALAGLVLASLVLIMLAARIYSRSLLRTGQRVSLRTALGSGD
ncbi:ABC transporter permease [Nesterenkonia halotolerans]|uniref:ABC-2 type transport system permease protein n=1 Tax=Nesterenkonia halotolerans TaxID=225325 RepID=A0ABR9J818_9MICC|nr:ABC transporter permease [Nesterenkonia halotolerans]MBE1515149.1 ABC-2 type transport system permease protein [Nesterenkonia halotolerans]